MFRRCQSPSHRGRIPLASLIILGQVSPDLVCHIQAALKRPPRWDAMLCGRVAKEMNKTPRPRVSLAIAILESHLRPGVSVTVRPGVSDVGLMGIRCVQDEEGACTVGPAKGHTLDDLKDPVVSVRVAGEIMRSKQATMGRRWLCGYGGASGKRRICPYSRTVMAMEAALRGKRPAEGIRRHDLMLVVWKAVKKHPDPSCLALGSHRQ